MIRKLLARIVRYYAPGFAVLLCLGCAGSLETARAQPKLGASPATAERCDALDDRRTLYGGFAKTFGALGAGAGLASIPVEDEGLQTGLAISAAASAALAVGALYVSEGSAESWARECAAR
jgi:hypothetical protein